MAYHIYQTRGFIIRDKGIGEADRTIFIFTESMGLLSVHAQAARKVSSKLRYSLQCYSLAHIALVRGKNIWRVTDAAETVSFSDCRYVKKLKLVAGIFSFIIRFVHGEGENETLFKSLEDLFTFLQKEELSDEEMFSIEVLVTCRVLSALGYIGENRVLASFLGIPTSRTLLSDFIPHQAEALKEINRAIIESQL